MKKFKNIKNTGLFYIWIAALALIADQVSKAIILMNFQLNETMQVLPFFNLTLVFNTGAAFSFLDGQSGWQHFFLGGVAVIAILFMVSWLYGLKREYIYEITAINMILGGAIGNLLDRIVQAKVTDFLHFHFYSWSFAIFNVADMMISIGAIILVYTMFLSKKSY